MRIIRIDPVRKTIAAMTLRPSKDPTPQIRKMLRTNNVGSRQIMAVDDAPLMAICGLDVDEEVSMWRLRGTEDNAGVGILTGRNPISGSVIDVPVTTSWVRARVQWLEGESRESQRARAEEMLPSLNDDIREALRDVVITTNGDMWIPAAAREKVGGAMQTLGLGTERSGGQMLTRLGETLFDLMGEN